MAASKRTFIASSLLSLQASSRLGYLPFRLAIKHLLQGKGAPVVYSTDKRLALSDPTPSLEDDGMNITYKKNRRQISPQASPEAHQHKFAIFDHCIAKLAFYTYFRLSLLLGLQAFECRIRRHLQFFVATVNTTVLFVFWA